MTGGSILRKLREAPWGRILRASAAATVAAVLMLAVIAGVIRVAVLTEPGRDAAERIADGLEVGRLGTLEVEGLDGDLFGGFTVSRLAIRDRDGVWLDVRNAAVEWAPLALLGREIHARSITAELVEVRRRPRLSPKTQPDRPPPVSVRVDRLSATVAMHAAFSVVPGRWRLVGDLDLDRVGPRSVRLDAAHLEHAGDRASIAAEFGDKSPLRVRIALVEPAGGSLAGALGFPPDRRFVADLRAEGGDGSGRLEASIASGDARPLAASGRWSAAGADLRGSIRLDASSLTASAAARLGPELRFGAAVRGTADGDHGGAFTVVADHLRLTGRGPVDMGRRRLLKGFRIRASAPSLAPFSPGADGRATFDAAVEGNLSRWTVDGRLRMDDLHAAGWRARLVEGPVEASLGGGGTTVRSSLQAVGGGGDRWWSELIGARPQGSLTATRHPDGRWVIDRAEAKGAALALSARGARGLTGAASFRARIQATDLGRIRRSAGGEMRIDVSGSSLAAGKPWTWRMDGAGRVLRTGFAELDRLLGRSPALQGRGDATAAGLSIESLSLSGDAARLRLSGNASRDLELDLDGDWSAAGPFGIGPVVITGRAAGDGVLRGTPTAPVLTLRARFDAIDVPRLEVREARLELEFARGPGGSNGRASLAGLTAFGPGRASSEFTFSEGAIALSNLDVDGAGVKVGGDATMRRGAPSTADLTFAVGPGVLLSNGAATGTVRLGGGGPEPRLALDVIGSDLAFPGSTARIRSLRLEANGTTTDSPYVVSADVTSPVPVQLRGDGTISRADGRWTVAFSGGGGVRGARVRTLDPAIFVVSAEERSADLRLTVAGGRLTAKAVQSGRRASLEMDMARVDLRALTGDLEGRASGRLRLAGEGSVLGGEGSFELDRVYASGGSAEPAFNGRLDATLAGDRLQLRFQSNNSGGLDGTADLTVPAQASASPLLVRVDRARPMTGRFDLSGEVKPLWDLVMGADRTLAGRIDTRGVIAGSLNAPEIRGSASLTRGRFEDYASGLVLDDITGEAAFDPQAVRLQAVSASDGDGGRLSGTGVLQLTRGSLSNLTLDLDRFTIVDNDRAQARASGALNLTRDPGGAVRIAGDLRVTEAEIEADPVRGRTSIVSLDVVEINRPAPDVSASPNGGSSGRTGRSVALDIGLNAPGQVFLRGRGLNAEFALDARVEGTLAAPRLTGVARVVRGEWEFAGRRFEFDDDGRVILSMRPDAVRLDLRAVREDPNLTAVVRVQGTAASPTVTLTSTPALPQDEILAQVLFGRSSARLSAVEAAQVAAAVAALAGGGGFDVLGGLRELAGLDRLSFGSDAVGVTVAGGKYLSDDIYLEIIGGGQQGSAVEVEWRARKNVSILSRITGQGAARLSVRWRREVR